VSTTRSRWGFGLAAALVFLFLYGPLLLIVLYAFNKSTINAWPFPGFSTRWFTTLFHDPVPREAAWLSVRIALAATALAVVLGTCLAFAFARHRFRGSEGMNFAVTLPIILPGAITGGALAPFFFFAGRGPSTRAVVIGATTFPILIVFNNVLARLRRVSPSLEEASRDLGGSGWQTFRLVTFPTIRTALIAGADTTTLPLWILGNFRQAQQLPEVNAVATLILLVSLPMIAISAYLMRESD